jgi:uncharacterized protein YdhG (YjbR/CyaY superfamily)
MIAIKPATIDEYIAGFPSETKKLLEQVRAAIRKAAPGAEEYISYGIPAFKLKGHYVIYFAGYKNHISLYPAPAANKGFEKDYAPYYTSGKGTIQFPVDKPMPVKLITKIVKFRMQENIEKQKKKTVKVK